MRTDAASVRPARRRSCWRRSRSPAAPRAGSRAGCARPASGRRPTSSWCCRPGRWRCRRTWPRCRRRRRARSNRVDYRPRAEAIAGLTGRPAAGTASGAVLVARAGPADPRSGAAGGRGRRVARHPPRPAARALFSSDREALTYRRCCSTPPAEFERMRARRRAGAAGAARRCSARSDASRLRGPRLQPAPRPGSVGPDPQPEAAPMRAPPRRPRPDACCRRRRRRARSGGHELHAGERPAGRGDRGPPRAGRHPDGLVQGRLRRRAARPVGHRAFPRAPDVQGHRRARRRRVQPHRRRERRRRQRLHLDRLHRLLPAHRRRPARPGHGHGGRPHGRPRPDARRRSPPSATWCSRSAGRWWRTTPAARSASSAARRSTSTIPTATRSSAGSTRSRRSPARRRWRSTARTTRRTTPSWWWPATSTPAEVERLAEKHFGPIPAAGRRAAARAPAGAAAGRRAAGRDTATRACASPTSAAATSRRSAGRATRRRRRRSTVLAELLGGSAVTSVMAPRADARRGRRARRRRLLLRRRRSIRRASASTWCRSPASAWPRPEARARRADRALRRRGPRPGAARAHQDASSRAAEIYALDSQQGRARADRRGAGLRA